MQGNATPLYEAEGAPLHVRGRSAARAVLYRCQFCGDPVDSATAVQGPGGVKWCDAVCKAHYDEWEAAGPVEDWEWPGERNGGW